VRVGLLIAVGVCIAIAFVFAKNRGATRSRPTEPWPVTLRTALTRTEQVLYWRLLEALPDHIVLAQVSFSQLVAAKPGQGALAVFNRFRQLSADFVVCNKDFRPVAVIELDDQSHDAPRRQAADAKKHAVLEAVSVPLVRLNTAQLPPAGQIRELLAMHVQVAARLGRRCLHVSG
jgi:hypothetical protein